MRCRWKIKYRGQLYTGTHKNVLSWPWLYIYNSIYSGCSLTPWCIKCEITPFLYRHFLCKTLTNSCRKYRRNTFDLYELWLRSVSPKQEVSSLLPCFIRTSDTSFITETTRTGSNYSIAKLIQTMKSFHQARVVQQGAHNFIPWKNRCSGDKIHSNLDINFHALDCDLLTG